MLSYGARSLPGAVSIGTTMFLALALSGCKKSSLKVSTADAGLDRPGSGYGDSGHGTGGAGATGGSMAIDGATSIVDGGGATGQGTGGVTATGGMAGIDGSAGQGGSAGIGAGGVTRNGGAPGTGGFTDRGGAAGTAAGGATSTGGKTATGGSTGTGGLTGGASGTGGTGGVGGTGGGTGAIMVQPLINAFCTAAKSCCGRESYPSAALADRESKFPSRSQYVPLLDKGTVIIDQNALATCVAAYNTVATTCTITGLNAACKGVFVGTQAQGQPCGGTSRFGAFECRPVNGSASCHLQASGSDPTNTGVCTSIPRGKSGDECSKTCLKNETCIVDMIGGSAPFPAFCFEEDGLYCSVVTSPAVCQPFLPIDHACVWDPNSCGPGNFCGWTSNTCQAASKLGESCTDAVCAEELTCGTSNTCEASPFAAESICKGTPFVP